MRWLFALVVFALIVSGAAFDSLAAEEAHTDADHQEETHHAEGGHGSDHHATIGVPQPQADLEKSRLPGKIELLEPKALVQVSGTEALLKWKPVEGAEVYHVQVAKDPRFKWLVSENHNVNGDSYSVSGLEPGQQYFWRVAGRRPGNIAGWTKGLYSSSSFETK